jgi:ADP-ribose pyrophosphatase YjhB (NUDIX family)
VTCASCGTSHWRNPLPCANGVVIRDGRVLLCRRAYAPWRDLWCSPGGFCELGEHPVETVVRETLEETGLHVEVEDYVGTWVDVYSDDADDPDAGVINVAYYSAALVGDEQANLDPAEVSELGWFSFDALPDELAPPGTLEAVLAAVTSPGRSRRR